MAQEIKEKAENRKRCKNVENMVPDFLYFIIINLFFIFIIILNLLLFKISFNPLNQLIYFVFFQFL